MIQGNSFECDGQMAFCVRASECAPIKAKMQYASSKDSLKKVMTGTCALIYLLIFSFFKILFELFLFASSNRCQTPAGDERPFRLWKQGAVCSQNGS